LARRGIASKAEDYKQNFSMRERNGGDDFLKLRPPWGTGVPGRNPGVLHTALL